MPPARDQNGGWSPPQLFEAAGLSGPLELVLGAGGLRLYVDDPHGFSLKN